MGVSQGTKSRREDVEERILSIERTQTMGNVGETVSAFNETSNVMRRPKIGIRDAQGNKAERNPLKSDLAAIRKVETASEADGAKHVGTMLRKRVFEAGQYVDMKCSKTHEVKSRRRFMACAVRGHRFGENDKCMNIMDKDKKNDSEEKLDMGGTNRRNESEDASVEVRQVRDVPPPQHYRRRAQ